MLFSEPRFVLVLLSQETQSFRLKRGIALRSQVVPPTFTFIAVAVLVRKLLDISVPTITRDITLNIIIVHPWNYCKHLPGFYLASGHAALNLSAVLPT